MLEIHVFDKIIVTDSLDKAIELIIDLAKEWFESENEKPFSVKVNKLQNKAPPTLEISVSETIKAKSVFG